MATKRELEAENATLRQICRDLAWMSRRYVDGRMSYAVGLYNGHARTLLALGITLNLADSTPFARDGMGRRYDGLTEVEAAEGDPPLSDWKYSPLMEGFEEGC